MEIENCGNYIKMQEIWKTKKKIIIQKGTWETYIQNFPEWDRVLVEKTIEIDKKKLLEILRNGRDIILCSDGGADENNGSYGATIANKERILIVIQGRAFGNAPGSFRAEAYGMLALL